MKSVVIGIFALLISLPSFGTGKGDATVQAEMFQLEDIVTVGAIDEVVFEAPELPVTIQIYNSELELVYETEVKDMLNIKDRQLKKLLRKSSLITTSEDTSLFRLN